MKPGTSRCKHLLLEHANRRTLEAGSTWRGHCLLLLPPSHADTSDHALILANLERLASGAARCPHWPDGTLPACPTFAAPEADHG